jgi:hypothetical protein
LGHYSTPIFLETIWYMMMSMQRRESNMYCEDVSWCNNICASFDRLCWRSKTIC